MYNKNNTIFSHKDLKNAIIDSKLDNYLSKIKPKIEKFSPKIEKSELVKYLKAQQTHPVRCDCSDSDYIFTHPARGSV